jgi:hypothetical protein
MADPITTSVGLGFLGSFYEHCFQHVERDAYEHLIKHLKEYLHDGELPANHDLRKAVNESLLEASHAFALGVAAHLGPKPPLMDAIRDHLLNGTFSETPLLEMRDVRGNEWVTELITESRRAHEAGGIEAEFILKEGEVTKLLLDGPPSAFQHRVRDAFADWLKRQVQSADRPACVDDFLADGWPIEKGSSNRLTFYQAFSLFFQAKVKQRSEVFNILIAQTVSGIMRDVKELAKFKQPSFDDFQNWLGDQFAQLKEWLSGRFDQVDASLNRIEQAVRTPRLISAIHQLPPSPTNFTGHDDELIELEKILSTDHVVGVNISGTPGVGKTAFATVLAHRLKGQHPDAQLYLNLRGTDSAQRKAVAYADAMQSVIHSFYPDSRMPESADDLANIYRSVLADAGRVLLFLDNAANDEQIKLLLPPSNCVLLVTSRMQFTLSGFVPRTIECLAPPVSQELLRKLAERIKGYEEKAAELCGHLPLALEVFAGAVNNKTLMPVTELLKRLHKRQDKLAPVDAAFQVSYELLTEELKKFWPLLAVFPASFDLRAAAAVWEEEEDSTRDAMQMLVNASLVEYNKANGRFHLHDLVRQFCNDTLAKADRVAAQLCHAAYFTEVASEAKTLYTLQKEPLRGLAIFDQEAIQIEIAFENLEHARRNCTESAKGMGIDRIIVRLVGAVGYLGGLRFTPPQRIEWLKAEIKAARRLGNRFVEAQARSSLGIAFEMADRSHEAKSAHEAALFLFRELKRSKDEAIALTNLGRTLHSMGKNPEALEQLQIAMDLYQHISNERGKASCLLAMSIVHTALGKAELAIGYGRDALRLYYKIKDGWGQSHAREALGRACEVNGQPDEALVHYEAQRTLLHELGNNIGEIECLVSQATVLCGLDQIGRAKILATEALNLKAATRVHLKDYVNNRLRDLQCLPPKLILKPTASPE